MVTWSQAAVEQLQTVTQIAALSMALIEGNHPMWRHYTDMVKNCDHQIYPGLHTFFLSPTCAHTHTHSPHSAFWDIVVVTARDEEQRRSYEEQIELKKSRAEIPGFVK